MDPQLLLISVALGVSVELAWEKWLSMDSITHIKLLYQVLPWLRQGSPFPSRSGQGYSEVPASGVPCHHGKAPVPAGPPLLLQGKLSLGQHQAGAKCQTTRVPAARGHQISRERGFSQ